MGMNLRWVTVVTVRKSGKRVSDSRRLQFREDNRHNWVDVPEVEDVVREGS